MNTTKTLSVIALALLLTACGGGKPRPVAITLESEQPEDIALPSPAHNSQLKLPIGNHWNTWQCREGSFDTRYSDSSKQSLQLRYMSGEHTLEQRRPNRRPRPPRLCHRPPHRLPSITPTLDNHCRIHNQTVPSLAAGKPSPSPCGTSIARIAREGLG